MTKLKSFGIQRPLLSWIENCLLDRKQRVVINGCCSDWGDVVRCPSWINSGTLFFIIYINDILADKNSSIKLFADETSLFIIVDDPVDAAETLNTDMRKNHDWSMKWLVKFNPDKTVSMIVFRNNLRIN